MNNLQKIVYWLMSHPYVKTGTIRNLSPKIHRNEPCPCGSGKKYKKCCFIREVVVGLS